MGGPGNNCYTSLASSQMRPSPPPPLSCFLCLASFHNADAMHQLPPVGLCHEPNNIIITLDRSVLSIIDRSFKKYRRGWNLFGVVSLPSPPPPPPLHHSLAFLPFPSRALPIAWPVSLLDSCVRFPCGGPSIRIRASPLRCPLIYFDGFD